MKQPGIEFSSEESGILARPGKVAVVPNVLGQHDGSWQPIFGRSQQSHDAVGTRPQVGCLRRDTLRIERDVRHTRQHRVPARRMRVVTRDDRTQHGDLVGELCRARHEFADLQATRSCGNRLKGATNFQRCTRLRIPRLVLSRPSGEPKENHGLCLAKCGSRTAAIDPLKLLLARGQRCSSQLGECEATRSQAACTQALPTSDVVHIPKAVTENSSHKLCPQPEAASLRRSASNGLPPYPRCPCGTKPPPSGCTSRLDTPSTWHRRDCRRGPSRRGLGRRR